MEKKTYLAILISLVIVFFIGYYTGDQDSFAVNCYRQGLVPVITPDDYRVCWNKTETFNQYYFESENIGGYTNGS